MKNCPDMFLTGNRFTVLLTMTFLVGVKDDDTNEPEEEEEFIVNDYHWASWVKSAAKFRGISIIPKPDEKFDLYLHGAVGKDERNTVKIGHNLKKKLFYTLQVCWASSWGADPSKYGHTHISNGFYLLYKDGKTLIEKTLFKHNTTPQMMIPAFYLGGFNASTNGKGVVKSKCYTGIISNLEIAKTRNSYIPDELLRLIVMNQTVINNDWAQVSITNDQLMEALFTNTEEEENNEPPAAKRMKFI
jgi:hypothetical protein